MSICKRLVIHNKLFGTRCLCYWPMQNLHFVWKGIRELKKIKWYLNTGFAGCRHEGEIEVEDDETKEEIEELAKEEAFSCIDWGWYIEE